jgi:hypothetical protein
MLENDSLVESMMPWDAVEWECIWSVRERRVEDLAARDSRRVEFCL